MKTAADKPEQPQVYSDSALKKGFTIEQPPRTTKAVSDLVLISLIVMLVFLLALVLDAFEWLTKTVMNFRDWRLDEVLVVLMMLAFAATTYSIRRWLELRKLIEERTRAETLAAGQSHVLELIATGVPLSEVLEELTGLIEKQSKGAYCCITLFDPNEQCLRVAAAPHLPKGFLQGLDGAKIGPSASSCGTAVYLAKPVFAGNIETDPLWADYRDLALNYGLKASWCLPIYATNGKVLGAFSMYFPTVKNPARNDVQTIEAATHIAGIAIERIQAQESLRQYASRLENMQEIDRAILAAHSPKDIAEGALRHIRQLVNCQWAEVVLFDFETEKAWELATCAKNEQAVGGSWEMSLEKFGLPPELEQGQAQVIEDLAGMEKLSLPLQKMKAAGLRSSINVPLICEGKLTGCLTLGTEKSGTAKPEYLAVAREVAGQLAITIQNARLFEQVRTGHERLQILSQRLVEAQEIERRRIARELHDEVGQALTAVKINLQSTRRLASPFKGQVDENIAIVEHALHQVRNLSLDLRPSILDDLGLAVALRWLVERQAQRAGLAVQFNFDQFETRLPSELETICFRVTQEAVTNIMKHSRAENVTVELRVQKSQLHLVIQDDGVGFDVKKALKSANAGASLGLLSMQERVALSGGQFEVISAPGAGVRVEARFPLSIYSK